MVTGWQPVTGDISVIQKLSVLPVLPINLSTWHEQSKMLKHSHCTYLTTKLLAEIHFCLSFPFVVINFINFWKDVTESLVF